MAKWLAPKKAAQYLKEVTPETMIKENTIRQLISNGFPCAKIGTRTLVNVETFDQDLKTFSIQKTLNTGNTLGTLKKITV